MAGTNSGGALTEDWMIPTPSPRTLMSSFLSDDFSSGPFSDIFGDNGNNKPHDGIENSKAFAHSSPGATTQVVEAPHLFESNIFGVDQKSSSNCTFAEKIAARSIFGALKIDTSRVGYSTPIRSPITIPPGVSPRELLESPVFLPNAIAQPSPTIGKLPFLKPTDVDRTVLSAPKKAEDLLRDDCAFSFPPILKFKPPSTSIADKDASVIQQNQCSGNDNQPELSLQCSSAMEATTVIPKTSDSMLDNDHPVPADEEEENEANQIEDCSSAAEDGYNWRKYGQKQVKNSEHPRGYYKCSHPDCPVKKKVERSQEGHITEIVYKFSHNHPIPPPNRQQSVPFSHSPDLQADGSENFGSMLGLSKETPHEKDSIGHFQDMHGEALDLKSVASLKTEELADKSVIESREAVDVSSTLSNEDDDRGTHGTVFLGHDGDEDGTETKRRKMDSVTPITAISTMDMGSMASRAVREPRVVVQTTSDVDILDDGYRWRKYGQKVVKGNPNPRSYYKCTHPGCSVRKHVERASHDLKSVITTYEGKHNHDVPAARNSGHPSSGPQGNGLHRRPEPAPGSLSQFGSAAAYGSFGLPPRDQFGAAGGFSFGMLPHGMAVPLPALRPVMPVRIAGVFHR